MKRYVSKIMGKKSDDTFEKVMSDPEFPVLVSFPRTGSHWLRMMLESYASRPLLQRSFFEHDNNDYLLFHTHDDHLTVQRNNVIYLYREPVSTVFSLISYYKQDWKDRKYVVFWTHQYAVHLSKWLFTDTGSVKKTVIRHDELKNNFLESFKLVTDHLELEWDAENAVTVRDRFDKRQVKKKSDLYNDRVMGQNTDYQKNRQLFTEKFEDEIEGIISNVSNVLLGDESMINKRF